MSLQKEGVLDLPEEDNDERGDHSHSPADQSDDEDEDYSWVQQLDDFLAGRHSYIFGYHNIVFVHSRVLPGLVVIFN